MGNAFSIIVGIATITGAICSRPSTYATYALKLDLWPFTSKPPRPILSLHKGDHYLLREFAFNNEDINQQPETSPQESITDT